VRRIAVLNASKKRSIAERAENAEKDQISATLHLGDLSGLGVESFLLLISLTPSEHYCSPKWMNASAELRL
jgi:hypothetical protein